MSQNHFSPQDFDWDDDPQYDERRPKKKKSALFGLISGLFTLFVLGVVAAVGLFLFGAQRFYAEGPSSEETVFAVASGSSLASVASALESEGLVADRWTFQAATFGNGKQAKIRAGEYLIPANASMSDILFELTEGRAISYGVTIPEGFTSWQAVQRINAAELLTGEITEIPFEGTLLPNTYAFERGMDRQVIIDQMRDAMEDALAKAWEARAENLPIKSPIEMLILASIVEKETGIASERPQVAAVFINRLNRGMRLQSDPTIIYGITKGQGSLGRGIRASEIDAKTDYNTYQIDGLPIGPIANPGIDALMAVAQPAETDDLYFVAAGATPNLGHVFAASYDQHQKNVAAYRKKVREYQAEQEAKQRAEASETSDGG